jgi:hypothetical protein
MHVGRLVHEALLIVAPLPRPGEELNTDELFARRRIWRAMAASPVAIPDAEALAVVLRPLVGIGYHASRVAKRARSQRGGEGRARTVRENAARRRDRLRARDDDLRKKNPRLSEELRAQFLGTNRKALRAALGKSR